VFCFSKNDFIVIFIAKVRHIYLQNTIVDILFIGEIPYFPRSFYDFCQFPAFFPMKMHFPTKIVLPKVSEIYFQIVNRMLLFKGERTLFTPYADQIVVIDKGKVIESGSHDDLITAKGYYYSLIKNQLELGN